MLRLVRFGDEITAIIQLFGRWGDDGKKRKRGRPYDIFEKHGKKWNTVLIGQ